MKRAILLAAVLLVFVTFGYAKYTLTSIDYPGANLTHLYGINNNGVMVGAYRLPGDANHAMMIKKGKFIPLAPGTILATNWSQVFKISDSGNIVGWVGDDYMHGSLLHKGVLTVLDFPGASDTYALDMNQHGTIVGYWDIVDADGNVLTQKGFTWKNGNFNEVDFPGAVSTRILGVNTRGDLVGWEGPDPNGVAGSGFLFSNEQG